MLDPVQVLQKLRAQFGAIGYVSDMQRQHEVEIAELRSQLRSAQEASDMFAAEYDRLELARVEDEERAKQQIMREEGERLYQEAIAEEHAYCRQFDDDCEWDEMEHLRQANKALRDQLKTDEERAAQTIAMLNATQRESILALNRRQGDVNVAQRNCTETQKAEIEALRAQLQEQAVVREAGRRREEKLSDQVHALQAKIIELHETRGDVTNVTEIRKEQQSTDGVASRTRKRRAEHARWG